MPPRSTRSSAAAEAVTAAAGLAAAATPRRSTRLASTAPGSSPSSSNISLAEAAASTVAPRKRRGARASSPVGLQSSQSLSPPSTLADTPSSSPPGKRRRLVLHNDSGSDADVDIDQSDADEQNDSVDKDDTDELAAALNDSKGKAKESPVAYSLKLEVMAPSPPPSSSSTEFVTPSTAPRTRQRASKTRQVKAEPELPLAVKAKVEPKTEPATPVIKEEDEQVKVEEDDFLSDDHYSEKKSNGRSQRVSKTKGYAKASEMAAALASDDSADDSGDGSSFSDASAPEDDDSDDDVQIVETLPLNKKLAATPDIVDLLEELDNEAVVIGSDVNGGDEVEDYQLAVLLQDTEDVEEYAAQLLAQRQRLKHSAEKLKDWRKATMWQELLSDSEDDVNLTRTAVQRRRNMRAHLAARVGINRMNLTKKYRWLRMRQRLVKRHPDMKTVWSDLGLAFGDPSNVSTFDLDASSLESTQVLSHPDGRPPEQPPQLKLRLLPYQKEGLIWLQQQEDTKYQGGVLADEMGMGKTISMVWAFQSELHDQIELTPSLVVAPTVAIQQWCDEISAHVKDESKLSVLIFHGNDRTTDIEELKQYDIVITSYAIVETMWRKQHQGFKRRGEVIKADSALHQIHWFRIILDEAHNIKDRSCNTARATFALESDLKWCLTGTPLQNRVGELYSLIRFLRADPFAYYFCTQCDCKSLHWRFSDRSSCDDCGHKQMHHFCYWNMEILKPIQEWGATDDGLVAFRKLGRLLDQLMLRRTKLQKADDLGLPPRHVAIRRDYFSEEEYDFYKSLFMETKRQFNTYVNEGTVLNNYATIFELLTKMRQAADHPDMVTTRVKEVKQANGERLVCGICNDVAEDAIVSKCKHIFCREDMVQYMQSKVGNQATKCPVCFVPLVIDVEQKAIELPEMPVEGDGAPSATTTTGLPTNTSIVNRIDMSKWRSSTKIEALVEELTNLQRQDHTIKSIVFSQFVSFLDLIHWRLKRAGFGCVKLDGRMTLAQRDSVIKAFKTDKDVTVFLISLKAGGVALNLTEASQIFLMDPWWNPAAEDQAMDRIHRLGQFRPIRITRIVIENSIESRIIHLQEKKRALFESTVGKDMDALARLTEDDLKFLFVL
ncbi:DNA repair protein rad16 [Sorochytrium milnesiophthora]